MASTLEQKRRRYGQGAFLEQLQQQLALPSPPALLRCNTNLIYDCGPFVARLTPHDIRSDSDVRQELHWLAEVGAQDSRVVRLYGDDACRPFVHEAEGFTLVQFEKLRGEPISDAQWGPAHFQRLGSLTGALHRIGQQYDPPDALRLMEWDQQPEAAFQPHLPDDPRQLPALAARVCGQVSSMPCTSESYGPIHYDIHHGNYFVHPDKGLVLFDFENACMGSYLLDATVVLYYASQHKSNASLSGFREIFLPAFWRGYGQEYPIPEHEAEQLLWWLLYRGLLVYGYLHKIWPEPSPDEQLHFEKIARGIQHYREELGI